ncbi:2-dehydro-3-deoxygluconokinase [Paenibacillus sophorae]|uniref:2-dehydro-3-deoxygluconokinase n=1 Tax=Paenibacillus sophorae TaxID=1333845 RepID=A0A1H8P5N4_9BACL|nr:sugar kinase [Paenibacillus sophorae]QWU16447.1 sugar kinase [Paenibacillus sophorae]SEO37172.1 2-dehydro-3-deoxygluconokinase [Paenibacillus sophorae]
MARAVAAFGEVMMRLQVPGYALLSQSDTLQVSYSGTGVNVVSALARFGHTGYLVTTLPANAIGDAAVANLSKLGIQPAQIRRAGAYVGMYVLENGFGPRASRVTYTNRQESSFNTAPEGAYDFAAVARESDIVHFCGISLAMNDTVRRHVLAFARAVKAAGRLVAFDCNYRPALWGEGGYAKAKPWYTEMLSLADIVMMNEMDALHILGMQSERETRREQLEELIPQVSAAYDISVIAGTHRTVNPDNTHSLQGYIYKNAAFLYSDKLTFPVYDRIGAGDAYTSGIIHGELEGHSPETTVRFAAAAAMLAHTIQGDTPHSSESAILRAMDEGNGDVER